MFSTISGIIVMAVVAYFLSTAGRMFGEKFRVRITQALVCGISCGVITALSPKISPYVAMFFLIAVLMLMAYIVQWWTSNGSTIKELIVVSLADLLIMLSGQSAAARILDITSIKWIVAVIKILPTLAFILSIGYFISNMRYFKKWLRSEEFKPERYLCDGEEDEEEEAEISFFERVRRWLDERDSTYGYLKRASDHCLDR